MTMKSFLYPADHLSHRSHRAVYAPGTRAEQDHRNGAQDGGGQHDAVKSERKLLYPIRNIQVSACEMPWNFKGPKHSNHLFQGSGA